MRAAVAVALSLALALSLAGGERYADGSVRLSLGPCHLVTASADGDEDMRAWCNLGY